MLACRILNILVTILGFVTLPVQVVTTFVGGCLVSCTFGLLLLPLNLVWVVLLGLLLGTSWMWDRADLTRIPTLTAIARVPVAIIGIPLALLSQTFNCLVPSMGELEARRTKIMLCWVWPFSLDYWRFMLGGTPAETPEAALRYERLEDALRIASGHVFR